MLQATDPGLNFLIYMAGVMVLTGFGALIIMFLMAIWSRLHGTG